MPDLTVSNSIPRKLLADRSFLLLLLLALALRLLLAARNPALLLEDADGYTAHATATLQHHGFVGPFTGQPTAFRPPLYPMLLAAPLACGLPPIAAVLLINLLTTVVCCFATGWLAGILLPARLPTLLCVAAVALDPLLLRYSLQPMTEVPCAALLTLACAVAAGVCQYTARPRTVFLCGLLLAFAALIRPTVLLAAAAIWVQFVIITLRAGKPSVTKQTLKSPLLLALGIALGLAPWLARNAIQFRAFIPATTHGGYTLALGNNPDFYHDVIRGTDQFPWEGTALDRWQRKTLSAATASGINPADELALDRFHYDLATQTIRMYPRDFLRACWLRCCRFWAIRQTSTDGTATAVLISSWYLVLWAGLILKLLQTLRHLRTAGPDAPTITVWLCCLAFAFTHLFYWTDTRMRTPILPLLIVLSVSGGWQTLQWPGTVRSSQPATGSQNS
jgi:4-amino-4-deoxy-L-arabinose transferase-like glycosyltransferase